MLLANLLTILSVTASLKTSEGVIELNLLTSEAPQSAGNFVALARKGFYDGSRFHRVVPGHSLIGGAPKGESSGGPGYCFRPEAPGERRHTGPGLVSMVSTTGGTLGSQFQITTAAAADLDGRSPIFATVATGQDVVDKLAVALTASRDAPNAIETVTISGDFTPPEVAHVPELDAASLAKFLGPAVKNLAVNIGKSMGLGRLDAVTFESGRSRCADAQALFRTDFHGAPGSKLLIYAVAGPNSAEVHQFQFDKGGSQ